VTLRRQGSLRGTRARTRRRIGRLTWEKRCADTTVAISRRSHEDRGE